MATTTLDRVLASAEALPADERAMLEELLHRRRAENWRTETAAEAVATVKAFRSGKLKAEYATNVIAILVNHEHDGINQRNSKPTGTRARTDF